MSRRGNNKDDDSDRPGLGLVVGAIVAVILIILVIFLIIKFSTRSSTPTPEHECVINADCPGAQVCTNGICITLPPPLACTFSPSRPVNVTVIFNALANTATISWSASPGAIKYKVYRRLADPGVSKVNFDEKIEVIVTTANFVGLDTGTHYFVVSACNECGDSDESAPALLAPSCSVLPPTPSAPLILTDTDLCGDAEQTEFVEITVDEATGAEPFNILTGNGQIGVNGFFAAFPSPGSPFTASLACTGSPVGYQVTHVTNGEIANLTSPTGPLTLGGTLDVIWQPIVGADEYAITLVAVDGFGSFMFVGGYAPGSDTSVTITTPSGTGLIFAEVIGYKFCDKSAISPIGFHIPPITT